MNPTLLISGIIVAFEYGLMLQIIKALKKEGWYAILYYCNHCYYNRPNY